MRKYLMAGVATAALMFGLNQAMAQSSMSNQGAASQGTTSAAPSTSQGGAGSMKPGASGSINQSTSQGAKTIGQARDQSESKGMEPSSKGDRDRMGDRDRIGQRDNDRMKSKTTTGQSRDEMKNEKGAQAPSSSSSTRMGQQPSTNEKAATTGSTSSSSTQLTTEQRTEVREKVLASAPRENNVNFSVNVGTVVPRTVHVAEVPETLIQIHPDWRGHRFFVVHDEIIIVDNDFRIIAVLPV